MKYYIFILLSCLVFISCKKDGAVPSNPFGIDYKAYQDVSCENGCIMYQNYGGPRIDLAIDTAYLLKLNETGDYQICYFFTNNDSLKISMQKFTDDYNYAYRAPKGENKITDAFLNNQQINIAICALSVQPQPETNIFYTVLNLSTSDEKGSFNGAAYRVVFSPPTK